MSIAKISRKAQQIRKHSPGMSWHSAQKKAAAMLRGGTHRAAPKKKKRSSAAVSGSHHHKPRKRSVGSTVVTVRRKSKKKGIMGTSLVTTNRAYQILEMGAGMAVGAAATHMVLRPLEHKAVTMISDPKLQGYAAKAMPWVEMFIGGTLFIVSGNKHIRNIGVGVMGSGVHGAMKQLPFHMHSPAETISGLGDYVQTRIPINGTIRGTIAGLIQKEQGYTKTPTVGGIGASVIRNNGTNAVRTAVVSGHSMIFNTPTVGEYGESEDDEILFRTNHFAR